MDNAAKLILTQPVLPPVPLEHLSKTDLEHVSQDKKKQIAKDFESVLLNKLFDQMKNTIGDWGFEKDGASEQVQGLFWLYLSQDVANNGGIGLWKDIYQFLTGGDQANAAANAQKSLDGRI
jgi:Rod binding domain-containing protein